MTNFLGIVFAMCGFLFVLYCLVNLSTVGCKKIMSDIADTIKSKLDTSRLKTAGDQLSSMAKQMDSPMEIIQLTRGVCQRCGGVFIGTTKDEKVPLQEVTFQGVTRMLCDECLQHVVSTFEKTKQTKKKQFSPAARDLRDILADIPGKDKDTESKQ